MSGPPADWTPGVYPIAGEEELAAARAAVERGRMDRLEVARIFDVPPWVLGYRRPRFRRLRWLLRRRFPTLVWGPQRCS